MNLALHVTLFALGATAYAGIGLLSQLSKDPKTGTYAYSMPSVILGSEICKLLISTTFLIHEEGSVSGGFKKIRWMPWQTLAFFSVPSLIYCVGNNLDILCNRYMDSATFQVCSQLKILATALLWSLVFRESLGSRKWTALCLLLLGGAFASWPSDTSKAGAVQHMYITKLGVVSIIVYASCSASAAIATEWIYKTVSATDSIHLQNIAMYTIGVITNFCLFFLARKPSDGFPHLFEGFNFWTWCLMLNFCLLGILISFIMKYLDNIQKLLMSGASMYVSAIFTTVMLDLYPTIQFVLGLCIVTAGLVTFHWDKLSTLATPAKLQDGLKEAAARITDTGACKDVEQGRKSAD
eukprot:TRINITY_DN1777_c0_g1_i2.p1 TRINITY_DN1777_c0_g1~~TRINITY_DN1777_c0_g1_i2.p1  ORF type:complete len:352 (-),score=30.64 TRINITY_DN1777_c0_g1_i2:45-1100(-)